MSAREEAFWLQVEQCAYRHPCKRCCWPWKGKRNKAGYGRYYIPRYGQIAAYRYMIELTSGAILLGKFIIWRNKHGQVSFVSRRSSMELCIMHRCDNPPCVNPAHLLVGTTGDNIRDAVRKRERRRLAWRLDVSTDYLLGRCEEMTHA